jgi:tetratricopeptide (TPR) repeat protein
MKAYLIFSALWLSLFPGDLPHNSDYSQPALHDTASPEGKEHFDKGLLLLHNFEYVDAAEEFILAQQTDPDFVLSYWGEAMTYDHPIWRDLNIGKARAALNKLGQTSNERLSKAKTGLEKDFLQGTEILFGTGSKPDREKAYADHMSQLYKKYDSNHDIATFYALSLLALKKGWSEWEEYNTQAAAIVNKVLKENPNHAGALHYLVHADDHPNYASQGLEAANKYAKVASYAGHALHMPSHIYLALGMWDDVVRSNEVSWQAGVDRKQKKNLNNDQLNYHAHLWLSYGYLQQGKFQRAKELIDNQVTFDKELSSTRARFHLMEMKGHYLFQTNEWNSPLAELPIKTDDLDASSRFTSSLLEGYKLFYQKKTRDLKKLVNDFEKEIEKASTVQKTSDGIAVCGVTRYTNALPTERDIRVGNRFLKQLQGLLAWQQKDLVKAENFFKESLPKEGSVVVGPPFFLVSAHESYGDFLLSTNRAAEALSQFDKSLAASPKRLLALKGKLKAAKALKDTATESAVKNLLQEMLKNGDRAAVEEL